MMITSRSYLLRCCTVTIRCCAMAIEVSMVGCTWHKREIMVIAFLSIGQLPRVQFPCDSNSSIMIHSSESLLHFTRAFYDLKSLDWRFHHSVDNGQPKYTFVQTLYWKAELQFVNGPNTPHWRVQGLSDDTISIIPGNFSCQWFW